MFHACVRRFDVTDIVQKFLGTKQSLRLDSLPFTFPILNVFILYIVVIATSTKAIRRSTKWAENKQGWVKAAALQIEYKSKCKGRDTHLDADGEHSTASRTLMTPTSDI